MDKIICIVGPTGIGKTKLSVILAKKFDGEIINADSTQVYKGLDIATAKVSSDEKEGIPHHLFDYQKDCRKAINEIVKKGKTPIIVGGTGLYIKAALYDYVFENEKESISYDDYTTNDLYKMLIDIDKNSDIHPNNRKRIIRAINYYNASLKPLSSKNRTDKLLYDVIFIGLTCNRDILYERINKRVDLMIENGLINEAKNLFDSNIRTKAVMTPIGYKEMFMYFDNQLSLDQSIELIKKRSRNYAKRQYTWNNHQIPVKWFDVDFNNFDDTVSKIEYYIKNLI